ncbi:MAG: DnaJ domain-containing protein [Candidatus Aminicenantes bacterium]|nr:DnaJ domain-containing protein [Candidatus Aminicenantes bacterium]
MNHIAYYLRDIYFNKKSGLLRFTHGSINKNLFFQNSNLIFAKTNQPEEKLGEVLYKLGKISKEVYSKIDLYIKPGEKLEDSLINQGLISKRDLYDSWVYQMREIALNIFPLFKGKFKFEPLEAFQEQGIESIISIPLLIEDGVRGMKYHPALKEFLEKKILSRKRKGHLYLLKKEEKDILNLIDGKTSTEDILDSTGYNPEFFWKSLYLLYCLNFVEFAFKERAVEEIVEKFKEAPPKEEEKVEEIRAASPEEKEEEEVKEIKEPPKEKEVKVEEPLPDEKEEEKVEEVKEPPPVEEKEEPEIVLSEEDKERLGEVEAWADKLPSLDYYQIFNVSRGASEGEIKKIYFDMARKYHPDSFERDLPPELRKKIEDVFDQITKAYETLTDKEKREEYDESTELPEEEEEEDLVKKANIRFRQGKTLYNRARYDDAVILLEEAVRLRQDKGSFFLLLALTEAKIPSLEKKAEQDFLKAIELESWNPECYIGLGLFYKQQGFKARAKKQFNKALDIDPLSTIARKELDELSGKEDKKIGKGLFSFVQKKRKK